MVLDAEHWVLEGRQAGSSFFKMRGKGFPESLKG